MKTGTFEKITGTVEVDETFVGDLEKNKHADKKRHIGRGGIGKSIVLGILSGHPLDVRTFYELSEINTPEISTSVDRTAT